MSRIECLVNALQLQVRDWMEMIGCCLLYHGTGWTGDFKMILSL